MMTFPRLRPFAVVAVIMALLVAACAPATPTPTPRPRATATVVAEVATEEATEAVAEAATEEATEAAEVATEEATEAAEVATEEATEVAAEVATEEATEAATEAPTTEATVEATVEATAEATEVAAATEEPTAEPAAPTIYEGAIIFSFPEGWSLTAQTDALVTISKGEESISVYGPDTFTQVLGATTHETPADELAFFAERVGLTIGDAVEGDPIAANELAKVGVTLPRRNQAGVAYLLDVARGKAVVVALRPDSAEASEDQAAAVAAVVASLVYPPTSYEGSFEFSFPILWTLTAASDELVSIVNKAGEEIRVYGPAVFTQVLGNTTQETDSDALAFFLSRTGLTVGEAVEGEPVTGELAKVGVTLSRRSLAGTAYLVDVANGRKAVVIWLHAADAEPSEGLTAAFGVVVDSLVYPADLVDVASTTEDFSTLAAAIEAAGLAETLRGGEFTVFAPTNAAFEALLADLGLTAEELLANTDLLTAVLQYHVIEGSVKAADIVAGEVATIGGENVTIAVEDGTVKVNDATVTTADVEAGNGVIHVIDKVLVPAGAAELLPTPEATSEAPAEATAEATEAAAAGTIVEVAVTNSDFSTLVAAVSAADLVETLGGEGPYTVFAPTNEAFAAALESLGLTAEELLAPENKDQLTAILTYHVVPSKLLAADLAAGEVETVNGAVLTIAVEDGKVTVNGANVVTADIEASNGVIHVIDAVLLPPEK